MPRWGGWDLGWNSRKGNESRSELMAKADHWDISSGAHPASCPFSLGMHYKCPPGHECHLRGGSVPSGSCMTGNSASCTEHCRHKLAAENLVSAQKLLDGEELELAKVTVWHVLVPDGTNVLVTCLGLVMLFLPCSGGRAAPVSHLHEFQELWGLE